ncbi:glycosyltransferase family 2 protein [Puniceicoccales bacterium CK1056]|uniref:Glycosyltransferase family 2 protein n=1 Tax=Oceanipulchritudo coccoides TaxID=2706888 RepID=A0A6B2M143_9BACT|nr:glycosyltransferase family 2 protein [Oceanipulchritudo coccoides]NDV62443.1 glycosyltransferase family 2 protein [Oceanipulchritudo coccoides]
MTEPLLAPEPPPDDDPREISAVVPVFNEEDSLEELTQRLVVVLSEQVGEDFEILFVDDGSTDGSWKRIRELHQKHPNHVRGLRHRRNFGKAAALAQGFRAADAKVIITMDADLQDQPEEIPKFIKALEEGHDLVSGWKQRRHDPLDKTLPSKVFNFVARSISGVKLHDMNCGFKAYRADVAKGVKLYGEMHRFIPILAHADGYRIGEIVVEHHARQHGHSKYGATRMFKGALDLLTAVVLTRYLRRPAHFFGGLGLLVGAVGIGVLSYLSIGWFLGYKGIGTRPLFFFGILGTLLSAQLISLGLVAELVLVRTLRLEPAAGVAERVGE